MLQRDYIIGTGWWCDDPRTREEGRPIYGSDVIRSAEFHHLWSSTIDGFTNAKEVLIIDSASLQKPPITNMSYKVINLIKNPGHAVCHTGQYSGWMASV